ncbi:ubiquinol-cytochrome c reductase cytochrome b subunit [Rothia nasimurium]|uniref:Cytochrome bc1 complex cytochrome b subunit n=1 Tax=Rothia nasimurium TaxID=85336 RepID=A0A4Y9F5L8_9MICC|nr:cytochrome bc complex cytochrome b subunit [Rothia nasimurium]MBF0807855.1 ubiquinol-cytochrome c reductase cytochrome b subunit [Rothia nasimurium]TFU23055.1 ubiquinol-cytochrome c reductase cytochrome b subunit [Rothia nasimurium]
MSTSMQSDYKAKTSTGRIAHYVDQRVGASGIIKEFGRKIFPDHWSFMFGEVALYSLVILIISGTFLTFFFNPTMVSVTYDGSYVPMKGTHMSAAYASTLDISFDVRGGLLMRQIHHWAALMFMMAMTVHMLRVFFTGAFRRPRELNWVVGCTLLIIGILAGFTGYSLPDDVLSGNGLRIIDGIFKSIPLVGTYISLFFFGGEFPGTAVIGRLYTLHIMIIPAMLLLLVAIHMFMVVLHKHTQYPGPGRTENNVVGFPVGPVYAAKAGGFFFIVFGIIAFLGATFTINAIWNYGPYDPSPVQAGTQPDWYVGFGDGALRLWPGVWPWPWEFEFLGGTWVLSVLLPFALMAGSVMMAMVFWPWIEQWVTKDNRVHNILDRPRNAPFRTGVGVAGIIGYAALMIAASSDLIATHFHVSLNDVAYWLRFTFVFGPLIGFFITQRICLALQRKDRELVLHGIETGKVVQLPHGEFIEVHKPLDGYRRYELVSFESPEPIPAQPNKKGKVGLIEKTRAGLSKIWFEDRVVAVTPAELEAAHHEHHGAHEVDGHKADSIEK